MIQHLLDKNSFFHCLNNYSSRSPPANSWNQSQQPILPSDNWWYSVGHHLFRNQPRVCQDSYNFALCSSGLRWNDRVGAGIVRAHPLSWDFWLVSHLWRLSRNRSSYSAICDLDRANIRAHKKRTKGISSALSSYTIIYRVIISIPL